MFSSGVATSSVLLVSIPAPALLCEEEEEKLEARLLGLERATASWLLPTSSISSVDLGSPSTQPPLNLPSLPPPASNCSVGVGPRLPLLLSCSTSVPCFSTSTGCREQNPPAISYVALPSPSCSVTLENACLPLALGRGGIDTRAGDKPSLPCRLKRKEDSSFSLLSLF